MIQAEEYPFLTIREGQFQGFCGWCRFCTKSIAGNSPEAPTSMALILFTSLFLRTDASFLPF